MLCQAGIKAEEKPIRMCRPILWMSQSRTFRATLGIQTGDRGSGIRDIGDKGRARRTSSRLIDVGYNPNPTLITITGRQTRMTRPRLNLFCPTRGWIGHLFSFLLRVVLSRSENTAGTFSLGDVIIGIRATSNAKTPPP